MEDQVVGSGTSSAVPTERSWQTYHPLRERIFRAPFLWQLREGSWPFLLSVGLPPLIALIALAGAAITGEIRSLWGVVGAVGVAAVEFISFALKRPLAQASVVTPCSWIALSDTHIRLGMSVFRPKILFAQIASVDRGLLSRGRWEPLPYGPRVRVRFVMRRSWTLASIAYPITMDPLGELTIRLQLAASRNQHRLRFPEDASDEEITAAYCRVEEQYRDWIAAFTAGEATVPPEPRQLPLDSEPPPEQACSLLC